MADPAFKAVNDVLGDLRTIFKSCFGRGAKKNH